MEGLQGFSDQSAEDKAEDWATAAAGQTTKINWQHWQHLTLSDDKSAVRGVKAGYM